MNINFDRPWKLLEFGCWMDGGSVFLRCSEGANEIQIDCVQNVVWEIPSTSLLPGRLYLNKQLVTQRSELETQILQLLEKLELKPLDQAILQEKLTYLRSEAYLSAPDKVKIKDF